MRKIRNYRYENQTGYDTNYLILWCYPVRKLLQRNGKETGQQKNYRLPARNSTFSFTTEKRSFDLKVNLPKRLRHRLSVKAKIKSQSANLSHQDDSHIAKHAVNFIPNWWNCVI